MSRDDTGTIKAGMAIVVSDGAYSDYNFGQVYIALKDFNYMEEAKKYYFEKCDEEFSKYGRDMFVYICLDDFEQYLISKGFLGLCNYREIHMGDYDFFDEDQWEKEWREAHNWEQDDENI
mgnify:CR=1 FL=1